MAPSPQPVVGRFVLLTRAMVAITVAVQVVRIYLIQTEREMPDWLTVLAYALLAITAVLLVIRRSRAARGKP